MLVLTYQNLQFQLVCIDINYLCPVGLLNLCNSSDVFNIFTPETLRRLEANRKERREEAKTAYEKALEEWEEMARIYTFKVMCNGDQELANRRFEELRDRLPSKSRITDFYAKYDPSRGIFEEAIQEDIFSEFFKDPQL